MIRPHVVNFRCERWRTPDGATITASLPAFSGQNCPLGARPISSGQITMTRLLTHRLEATTRALAKDCDCPLRHTRAATFLFAM
jgi:hypothetical protein